MYFKALGGIWRYFKVIGGGGCLRHSEVFGGIRRILRYLKVFQRCWEVSTGISRY